MREWKAMGEDKVNIEMLNTVKQFSIEKITQIANAVYKRGELTEDMYKSESDHRNNFKGNKGKEQK